MNNGLFIVHIVLAAGAQIWTYISPNAYFVVPIFGSVAFCLWAFRLFSWAVVKAEDIKNETIVAME